MADEASILRAAEADAAHARRLLGEHLRKCADDCGECASLAAHVGRAERQVELLTPAERDMQELF